MEKIVLHPCYFGPISQFVALAKSKNIVFENEDNYQKQTYRNRMYIYAANGKLLLNIPIKHQNGKKQHQKYRKVQIENEFPWQQQHWKSLQSAYRTSPFFEYYEADFEPLYNKKYRYLIDFNYDCFSVAMECLQLEKEINKTAVYQKKTESITDARFLVDAKTPPSFPLTSYTQVFENKHGQLSNLSVVDLIFNEGPGALFYLEQQKLPKVLF